MWLFSFMFSYTYLSPTFVFSYLMPTLSKALYNPKLDMIVVTSVSFARRPLFLRYFAQMNIMASPFTISPYSSTAKHLSASPSNANPTSSLFSLTYFCKPSICVEPAFMLMLQPSGVLLITYDFAPSASKTERPIIHVLPFAQSRATLQFSNDTGAIDVRYPIYLLRPE